MIVFSRHRRTARESDTLEHIAVELQKLDDIVGRDVKILRSRIEEASAEYGEAQ